MSIVLRACAWLLVSGCLAAFAAEPTLSVMRRGQTQTHKLSDLLKHPAVVTVKTDASDEAYKKPMRYLALPIEVLLGELKGEEESTAQFVALDGYAPVLAAKRLAGVGTARAYVAMEPKDALWPPLGAGKPSAGPFYLVWSNAGPEGITPSEWPYQLAAIRVQEPLANRFPLIVPDKNARREVWLGFAAYGKDCLPCHTINRQGEAAMGPDLNIPMNPTEYFTESALKKLVRDPKSVRDWSGSVMPGFDAARLSDAQLGNIVAYLKHMAGRKRTAQ